MPRIFISYRREDAGGYAGRLYDRLRPRFDVFMDVEGLPPGVDWVEELEKEVACCDVLLAMIGRNWFDANHGGRPRPTEFVAAEVGAALRLGKYVIPVLVGGASMPKAGDLPEDLAKLARRNALILPDTAFDPAVTKLIETIDKYWPGKAEAPVAGTVRTNPIDGLNYIYVPPGRFTMGASPGDTEAFDDEKPAHAVTISKGFWMGQTPVTVGAWKKYRAATGAAALPTSIGDFKNLNEGSGNDTMPAVAMTWDEANAYCKWAKGRLPTEAEWEYAARAGSETPRYGKPDDIAWYADNSGGGAHPVAQKQPNAWKLYDTLGNVWEWTADWFNEKYYTESAATDPAGPATGERRALRGGSWFDYARFVRVSFRVRYLPVYRDDVFGFRCVGE
jgi:formylglycine-generating enzyme required for sulfatase activity